MIDVIVPTYNNPQMIHGMLSTFIRNTNMLYKIHVINNGTPLGSEFPNHRNVTVYNMDGNLGWMGSINYGAKMCDQEYILMVNDDVLFLDNDEHWLGKLVDACKVKDVGASGPCSNYVLAYQNILNYGLQKRFPVKVLSGFCMLTKRSVFEKLGGLDSSLTGGDDIDYCIRVRDAGYSLVVCRDSFVFHHGCVSYGRELGSHYNSREYQENHNIGLIKKHGFKHWLRSVA